MRSARHLARRRIAWAIALGISCSAWAAGYRPVKPGNGAGDDLFTNSSIRHLQIEIPADGIQTLRNYSFRSRDESPRTNVAATIREGTHVWTNVALHLKGAFGSFRPINSKPSLTLNFDKWVEGQMFHGLEKISLNNSLQDPSYLSEKICREVYQAAGVPTPRADYATVELNGRHLGLFVLTEGWNKQFLKRHFSNTKGNFYDLGGGHDVNKPLLAASGEDPANHRMLEAVTRAANEPDHALRLAGLRETVDLDRFLSMLALDIMMWNWDGYALNRNNYRMFHDLSSDRLVFFPHGLDQMFWKPNGPIVTGRSGLVVRSLLETSQGRQLYLNRFKEIRSQIFDAAAIEARIVQLNDRIQPAVGSEGALAIARQQSAATIFRNRVMARARDIDSQLAGVKDLLRLRLDEAVSLTNWVPRRDFGDVSLEPVSDSNAPGEVRTTIKGGRACGLWVSTVWLEEGRYRVEGRMKTAGVRGALQNEPGGAGFRVFSSRKETKGPSWGWFPYSSSRDGRLGGVLPAVPGSDEVRLNGDHDWTTVTHEFELRQPVADLQIQCVLQGDAGVASFDTSSIRIRRLSFNVSKVTGVRGE